MSIPQANQFLILGLYLLTVIGGMLTIHALKRVAQTFRELQAVGARVSTLERLLQYDLAAAVKPPPPPEVDDRQQQGPPRF